MNDARAIVPSDGSGFSELSEEQIVGLGRAPLGRVFEKHILNKGQLLHPATGVPLDINDAFVDTMIKNFENKVCDIVQVPLAGAKNEHTEDPQRNLGEVIGIRQRDNKVYALIDARKPELADELGKTLLGVSAMLSTNYTDTRTGKKVGPTLLHACVTNRPYVTNLEDYTEVVAATADNSSEDAAVYTPSETVSLTEPATEESVIEDSRPTEPEENVKMTFEELCAQLKSEHNVDVPALQAAAAQNDAVATLTATFNDAIGALEPAGVLTLSNGNEVTPDALVGSIKEVVELTKSQASRIEGLEKLQASAEVDRKVEEGYLLPTQRDAFLAMRLTNEDLYKSALPAEPVIKMTVEVGKNVPEDEAHQAEQSAAVEDYAKRFIPGYGK